ncbi:spermidine/putrescine ABC transporter permease PotB [Enteractinococcus fodinae]|uniref:Spermidine/putrescine transport system permease protein n=1 Tax=Enteractinococcus fodinae TaxID=684663 RepID=A0ABU2B2U9_9MICC|nr:ABC transporter permease [Enteractinococcus fodinae]MDR7347933.1 spermidine/putrescine transport system permease protein [Enteractinococcus fodinae]
MRKFLARIIGPGALLFPVWAYAVFFFVIPVAIIFYYSFGYKPDLFTPVATDVLSLDQYQAAMSGTIFSTFLSTLEISITGTLACLAISVPFAYWLAVKVSPKRRNFLLALVLVPYWTNFLVRTLGWQITLSPQGYLSNFLQTIGLREGPLDVLYTALAVQIGVIYNYLPLMILPLFVAMDAAGKDLRDASYDLGAGKWSTFFRVTMPLAMPGVISGCLLVFVPLNGDYVTAAVLGGAEGTMIGQVIANQFNTAQDWALGSAMAVTLMLTTAIVVAIAGLIFWAGRKIYERLTRVDLELA